MRAQLRGLAFCSAIACAMACGCSLSPPPQISVVQIDSNDRAAKSPQCAMPILRSEPMGTDYRKIAIVEAWGTLDHKDEMLDALRQKACGAGADALLIVSSQSQVDGRLETMDLPTTEVQNDDGNSDRGKSYEEGLTPRIGQRGHPGYYLDAVAIIYENLKDDRRESR